MTTVGDFIKLEKTDFHSYLNTGMRFSSYISWSGFYIPEANAKEIETYSKIRITTEKDISSLISLSLYEAQANNIKTVYGTIPLELQDHCHSPARFIELIKKSQEKYSDKIVLKPVLGIDSDKELNLPLVISFLTDGIFEGVDVSGKNLTEKLEKFGKSFEKCQDFPVKVNFDCSYIKTKDELEKLISIVKPSSISGKIKKQILLECAEILTAKKICVYISPTDESIENTAATIKELKNANVDVKICATDILYTNKSLSEFANLLCNTQLLSKEETSSLFC